MRDLLNLLDNMLTEKKLAAGEMAPKEMSKFVDPKTKKLLTRSQLFLYKIKNNLPFTKLDNSKPPKPIGEVVIDPKEARAVAAWIASGFTSPSSTITMRTMDGGTVKNTQLLKTVEFGSKEAENIKIKPSDVLPTDDKPKLTI